MRDGKLHYLISCMRRLFVITFYGFGLVLNFPAAAQESAKPVSGLLPVDFKRDIQPLFQSRCYECHGPEKQKDGIRFDRRATVFHGGDSGKPIVIAGNSTESPLIRRVTSSDPEEVMPRKGERLTEAQVALLKRWIDEGAK